jgi:hypothetical protein
MLRINIDLPFRGESFFGACLTLLITVICNGTDRRYHEVGFILCVLL